ncbi:4-hydroxy-tetrahydrodipicolinate synthase [bioreactor metagenome]|uniref:4-hydroxy-tetrahydrodipicolinate synthase n=2 Tax=root TaxID=1 RepID=A0A098B6Z2_DESHA|nr:dihydrodipicolinate synthase family protein [Desulfitobacterium hafniense]MEA5022881.1 dihydrodipicolinate synthase family protein [Desulfitobacterium hafniense]CDX03631.1 4-hydroxy-tetrahydrodipicolinate synthase [Desulfitobacterium hafniense]
MFKLHGIYAPIPTPFKDNKIALDELAGNMEFWLASQLEGIVVMGSNGEFIMLSPEEKCQLITAVCTQAKGKKPVVVGTGCESTQETIEFNHFAAGAGADAALVLSPNYFKKAMNDTVLKKFYLEVAEASPIPIILYNMPGNSGINLSAKLVAELADHPNIIGIKDSGGNIVQIAEIIHSAPDDFAVFAGSASFLFASLALGAAGGTLALANVFPNECARLQELVDKGKFAEAKELQLNLIEANNAVTARWGVGGLKAALELIGLYGGEPRKPLMPLGDEDRELLAAIIKHTQETCR